MNLKRMIGIIACIGGALLIFLSYYISHQVEEGKGKISSAENKVEHGKALFGLNPYSKQIGQKVIFDPADKKIKAGKEEVAHYEMLARRSMIGGVILLIVGLVVIFVPPIWKGN